jgi:hypothetical protein
VDDFARETIDEVNRREKIFVPVFERHGIMS